MSIKEYKPITPSRRWITSPGFEEITRSEPYKPLTAPLRKKGGRNVHGHITTRHKGGGHKRRYRIIDFKRDKDNILAKVISIEYDPNRSARIALLEYTDLEKRYIIWPVDLKVGDEVISGESVEPKIGNSMFLKNIPPGTFVHNIELKKGKGAEIVRSAGTYAQIMAKEGNLVHLKLPSGEIRMVSIDCRATVGQVGNVEHNSISLGKAGRSRWLGIRPSVRGVAMNPHDHPMGGGEGKSSGGRHPCSPWGQKSKGLKTRKKNKTTEKYILKHRR